MLVSLISYIISYVLEYQSIPGVTVNNTRKSVLLILNCGDVLERILCGVTGELHSPNMHTVSNQYQQ